ncbi:MAG: hypothetical protein QXU87_08180 [Candidatus Caldarchaeum sp.]
MIGEILGDRNVLLGLRLWAGRLDSEGFEVLSELGFCVSHRSVRLSFHRAEEYYQLYKSI